MRPETLSEGVILLERFAESALLVPEIERIAEVSAFRFMVTRSGRPMSVAMTNCGPLGWVTDRTGYRYSATDPLTGDPWPNMPPSFRKLAAAAAERAGFSRFEPDACLINRYQPGARMGSHQDKDEQDFSQPIVSVSLGLPAMFQIYGEKRTGTALRVPVTDGDVIVFGGVARLYYHGVKPLADGSHPTTGAVRYNLTFRRAR